VITVLPITGTNRGRSTHVGVEPGNSGLSAVSYIRCEDVRAISPLRLEHRLGRVDEVALLKIGRVLRRLLAL
jgi:mRNA interferase MazF